MGASPPTHYSLGPRPPAPEPAVTKTAETQRRVLVKIDVGVGRPHVASNFMGRAAGPTYSSAIRALSIYTKPGYWLSKEKLHVAAYFWSCMLRS